MEINHLGEKCLEKVILINSSTFRLAEVEVYGNTHIGGDNSTNKTSFTQIVELFYTGSAKKSDLGIEGEGKKLFQDYHLSTPGSYIIYEVRRSLAEGDRFMVVLRNSNFPTFYFIDCPYSRDIFCDASERAYVNIEDVKTAASRVMNRPVETRKVSDKRDYIDILYGWKGSRLIMTDRGWLRYSITSFKPEAGGGDDRPHDKIVKLIQMMLRQGQMQGDVLKSMIISSLNSTPESFNVYQERDRASELYRRFACINNWLSDSVVRQSKQRFVRFTDDYRKELEQYKLYPSYGKYARSVHEELLIEINKELELAVKEYSDYNVTVGENREFRRERIDSLKQEKAVLEDKLKQVEKKREGYREFMTVLPLMDKEEEMSGAVLRHQQQLEVLSGENKNLLDQKNERIGQIDKAIQDKQKETAAFLGAEEAKMLRAIVEQGAELATRKQPISDAHQKRSHSLEENRKVAEAKRKDCYKALVDAEKSQPKKTAIDEMEGRRVVLQGEINRLKEQVLTDQGAVKIQKHALSVVEMEVSNTFRKDERLKAEKELEAADARLRRARKDYEAFDGSFAQWLADNKSDWKEDIGKVAGREFLLCKSLSPECSGDGSSSLYGVNVDLSSIPASPVSPDELKAEVEDAISCVSAAKSLLDEINQSISDEVGRRKAVIEEDLAKKNAAISEDEATIKTKNETYDSLMEQLSSLKTEQQRLVNEAVEKAKEQLTEAENSLSHINDEITAENKSYEDAIKKEDALEEERKKKLQSDFKKLSQEKEGELSAFIQEREKEKSDVEKDFSEMMTSRGVSKERLDEIQSLIKSLEDKLKVVAANKENYTLYKRDKTDWFDMEDGWKVELKAKGETLLTEEEKDRGDTAMEQKQLEDLQKVVNEKQDEVDTLEDEIKKIDDHFKNTRPDEYAKASPVECDLTGSAIIARDNESLQRRDNALVNIESSWKSILNKLGPFGIELFFGPDSYVDTIQDNEAIMNIVYDFIQEDRIQMQCLSLSSYASSFLNDIRIKASKFKSGMMNIRETVLKLNRLFRKNNFTRTIKRIELSVEDNPTSLLSCIRRSEDIYINYLRDDEDNFNLFDDSAAAKKLRAYIKEITDELVVYGEELITMSDMFSLFIEVDEGINKGTRKSSIKNTGSNGINLIFQYIVYLILLTSIRQRFEGNGETFSIHIPVDEQAKLSPDNFVNLLTMANRLGIYILANSPTIPAGTEDSFARMNTFSRYPNSDTVYCIPAGAQEEEIEQE